MFRTHILFGLFLFLPVNAIFADVIVTNVDEEGTQSEVKLSKTWGKIVDKSEPNQYMMIDLKKNSFFMIDNDEKIVVNLGDMSELKMMNPHEPQNQPKPNIEVKKMGKGPKVAGFNTTHYQLLLDGKPCSEHFISKDPLKHPEIKAFSDSMKKQMQPGAQMGFNQSPCEMAEDYFDVMVFDYGVPLLSKNMDGKETFKILEIKTGVTLPASEFELPKGYPVVTQAELMRREMGRLEAAEGEESDHSGGTPFEMPDMSGKMPSEEDMQKLQEQMQKQLQQLQQMMQQQEGK